MARVKTFANGGTLLPGDLNSIEDDYEFAFSTYKQIGSSFGLFSANIALASGSTYLFSEAVTNNTPSAAAAGESVIYLDPADYTANTRTNKYRLKVDLLTNATAPTSTFTVGLYPVTACAGGANTNSITLGTVQAGSTVAFTAPAASSLNQGNSGDFTAPAAGYFVIAVAVTVATMVANSAIAARAILQQRQV